MNATEPDELLMAQVAKGLREPLEPLIRRHTVSLLSFLRRMTGNCHDAEELFQETFLRVWRKRETYFFPRPFRPWLYAIALNCHRTALRSPRPVLVAIGPGLPEPSAPPDAVPGEIFDLVARAIAELPPVCRAVVSMRLWDEMSYTQIADAVGRTEATVRSHMCHGLTALRQALAGRVD